MDVINAVWSIESARNLPLSPFRVSLPKTTTGSALLNIQKAVYHVYLTSRLDEPIPYLQSHLQCPSIDLDGLVAALETTSKVWPPQSCSQDVLSSLCSLYITVCLQTNYFEAQVLCVESLTSVMDDLLEQRAYDKIPCGALLTLWTELAARPMNPALSNAVIRASGCIAAAHSHPGSTSSSSSLHAWGLIMADAALDDKVCMPSPVQSTVFSRA